MENPRWRMVPVLLKVIGVLVNFLILPDNLLSKYFIASWILWGKYGTCQQQYGVKLLSNYMTAHLLLLLLLLLLLDYHYFLSFVIVIVIVILFFIIFIFYTILYSSYFIVFILFVYSLFVIKYKNNKAKFILLVNIKNNELIVEQINNC